MNPSLIRVGFRSAERSPSRGFTLLELGVAVAIAALAVLVVVQAIYATQRNFEEQVLQASLTDRQRSVLAILRQTIPEGSATESPLTIGNGGRSISFRRCTGYDPSTRRKLFETNPVAVAFESDAGEVLDGRDNDGDLLVDEGRLRLTANAGARDTILTEDVNGVTFTRSGAMLRLSLTFLARSTRGTVESLETEVSFMLRN